jgi:hypothetical protein
MKSEELFSGGTDEQDTEKIRQSNCFLGVTIRGYPDCLTNINILPLQCKLFPILFFNSNE